MGYPEPDHDEPIILESRNVKFKSISFDAILTNKRIHLTASKKSVIPSQDIILATIRNVEAEENAIRDHFLILSLVTDAGEKHLAVLTFARQAGVERKRECNEWVKKLKSLIPSSTPVITRFNVPEVDRESLTKREVPTPEQGTATSSHPVKKKRELARIIEKSPVASEPAETTSLPSGSFCSRCGNRVPLKSTFCNNCGSAIEQLSRLGQEPQPVVSKAQISDPPPALQPVATKVQEMVQPPAPKPVVPKVQEMVQPPAPKPVVPQVQEMVQPPAPKPVVPQVQEMVQPPAPKPVVPQVQEMVQPPAPKPVVPKVQEMIQPPAPKPVVPKVQEIVHLPSGSPGEHQRSSKEDIIYSLEPLIKDSVPHAQYYPDLVQTHTSEQKNEPSSTVSLPGSSPQVVWPVFSPAESPVVPSQEAAPAKPGSPPPLIIPAPERKKPNYLAIGILIMAILPILAGLVIVANIMSGPSLGSVNTTQVIPVATTTPTQLPQTTSIPVVTVTLVPGSTQVMIPPTGVWVRVSYPGTYIGLIGTPGNQLEVIDSGDHFYQIPTNEGSVAAALQKKDGSGDQIILEVYKNGVMLKRESSVTPKGIVEIKLDLKTL
jgi:hypothetical protein